MVGNSEPAERGRAALGTSWPTVYSSVVDDAGLKGVSSVQA
jgi:hypothetical protein